MIVVVTVYEAYFQLGHIPDDKYYKFENYDEILENLCLVLAILYLKCKINSQKDVHSNHKLIAIHIINFICVSIIHTVDIFLKQTTDKIEEENPDGYEESILW